MKKIVVGLVLAICLSGCGQIQETVSKNDNEVVITTDSLDSSYYPIVQFDAYTGRNEYYNNYNSTSDFQKIGRDLEKLSTSYFDTSNHYMAEGQLLTQSKSYNDLLLWASEDNEYTLQPSKDEVIEGFSNVIMVSSVYELDFYQKAGDNFDLSGLSFGIVLKPITKTESGSYVSITGGLSDAYVLEYAKQATKTLYTYIQNSDTFKDYTGLPILISVYEANDATNSLYGGSYVLETFGKDGTLGNSKEVDFQEVVFSSKEATAIDPELSNQISLLKTNVKNASLESVGVVGYGTYYKGELTDLTLKVTANVKTYVELSYAIGVIASEMEKMNVNIDFTAVIYSQDKLEAFIVKVSSGQVETQIIGY